MRTCLIGLLTILPACSTPPTPELIGPEVPAELRRPCLVEKRETTTLRDVALILTDHVEALDCANGRILAIDAVLVDFEGRIDAVPQ